MLVGAVVGAIGAVLSMTAVLWLFPAANDPRPLAQGVIEMLQKDPQADGPQLTSSLPPGSHLAVDRPATGILLGPQPRPAEQVPAITFVTGVEGRSVRSIGSPGTGLSRPLPTVNGGLPSRFPPRGTVHFRPH